MFLSSFGSSVNYNNNNNNNVVDGRGFRVMTMPDVGCGEVARARGPG